MKHLSIALIIAAATASAVSAGEPLYVLEQPGIAFEWVPDELNPPVEGCLLSDEGALASSPSSTGAEYHIFYWKEDMSSADRGDYWLDQRLHSVMPPNMEDALNLGNITWEEGSSESPFRLEASLGLVVSVNFNFITEDGSVLANGRAYAIFVNGYSVLIYGVAPLDAYPSAVQVVNEMVSWAYLVE